MRSGGAAMSAVRSAVCETGSHAMVGAPRENGETRNRCPLLVGGQAAEQRLHQEGVERRVRAAYTRAGIGEAKLDAAPVAVIPRPAHVAVLFESVDRDRHRSRGDIQMPRQLGE